MNIQTTTFNIIDKKFQTKEYGTAATPCLICGGGNDEVVTDNFFMVPKSSGMKVVICKNCGFIRVTPYMDEKTLKDFYSNHYRNLYGHASISAEEFFQHTLNNSIFGGKMTYTFLLPFAKKYKEQHKKNKLKIFEVGCGYGTHLYNFHQDGEIVVGCDFGKEGVDFGKKKGLNLITGDINSLLPYGSPDILILNHVLEHILNVDDFFQAIKNIITSNTLVYIAVPSLVSTVFVADYNIYRHFQIAHVWDFTNITLDATLAKYNFKKIASNEIIQAVYQITNPAVTIDTTSEYQKNSLILQYLTYSTKRLTDINNENNRLINSLNENLSAAATKLTALKFKYIKTKKLKKLATFFLSSLVIIYVISIFTIFLLFN